MLQDLYRFFAILFAFAALSVSAAETEEPEELLAVRKIYYETLVKAAIPVTEGYLNRLALIRDTMSDTGDLEGALEIVEERKRILSSLETPETLLNFMVVAPAESPVELPKVVSTTTDEDSDLVDTRWECASLDMEISLGQNGEASLFVRSSTGARSASAHTWKRLAEDRVHLQKDESPENTMILMFDDQFLTGTCTIRNQNAAREITRVRD